VCNAPLVVPQGFTPAEYFEYSSRQNGTYNKYSKFNATCPGTHDEIYEIAKIVPNLVELPNNLPSMNHNLTLFKEPNLTKLPFKHFDLASG
jgi:hypothetical protein